VAEQVLGGKAVVLHYEKNRVLALNSTGTRVWECLDGTRTVAEITGELARESGVPVEQVAADVREFLAELAERDLVVICTNGTPAAGGPRESGRAERPGISEEDR